MAIPRKRALERLEVFLKRVDEHLALMASEPGAPALPHWIHETRVWLIQMEEMLRHVGKKTSAEWRAIIEIRKAKFGQ
jgi:hypothetical protein